jgi:hypothetical protein
MYNFVALKTAVDAVGLKLNERPSKYVVKGKAISLHA